MRLKMISQLKHYTNYDDKPKKFWSYIKAKRQDEISIPPLMSDKGLKFDTIGEAETLNAQFQKVFTKEDIYLLDLIRKLHLKLLKQYTSCLINLTLQVSFLQIRVKLTLHQSLRKAPSKILIITTDQFLQLQHYVK